MNDYSGNSANKFFYSLPDNPAEMTQSEAGELAELISEYPQSGLLRLLLVAKGGHDYVQQAIPYVKPDLLYKITKGYDKFSFVQPEQIVASKAFAQVIPDLETQEKITTEANYFHIPADGLEENIIPETPENVAEIGTESVENEQTAVEQPDEIVALNVERSDDVQFVDTETASINAAVNEYPDATPTGYFHQEIDDEIFEEIVGIEDINLQQLANADEVIHKTDQRQTESPAGDSVVEDRHFVFEPSLSVGETGNDDEAEHLAQPALNVLEAQPIAKYNDEKMPYSFMWWLDKTRREHASTNQPYAVESRPAVVPKVNQEVVPQSADLQQQYYENIFAVSAVVGELSLTPVKVEATPVETKEDKIIERFIQEEPQIKHPNDAKLNNENKAKKSSEDQDELVTETLAKIYSDQMLYHKAILTYKKLMLKFPEKSTYFAGQIEQLENKIN